MAKLSLRRFSLERYNEVKDLKQGEQGWIEDGTFFIITDTKQLGVRRKKVESDIEEYEDILTQRDALYDYDPPKGEVVITQNSTIGKAVEELVQRTLISLDVSQEALEESKRAFNLIKEFEYTDSWDTTLIEKVNSIESRIQVCSEDVFEQLPGYNPNTIYYIYEND